MHNDTPLGTMMRLRELERQAIPRVSPLAASRRDASVVRTVRTAMIALVGRLHAVRVPRRVASQG